MKLRTIDPERARAFVAEGSWRQRLVIADMRDVAARTPSRAAVVDVEGRWTWAELSAEVDRVAVGLTRLGVGAGDVVVVQLPNWRECIAVHVAIEAIGAITVPVPPIYRERELSFILKQTRAKVVVTRAKMRQRDNLELLKTIDAPSLEAVVVVRDPVPTGAWPWKLHAFAALEGGAGKFVPTGDPDSVSEIAFTSGSTGDPKGVVHSANTLAYEPMVKQKAFALTDHETFFVPTTLGHQLGFSVGTRISMFVGATVVLLDEWQPATAVRMMRREGVTFTVTTPTFLVDVLECGELAAGGGLPALRSWGLAGAVVSLELHARAHAQLADTRLCHIFGATEIGAMIINGVADVDARPDRTGKPAELVDIRVVDERDQPVADGDEGELLVRSPSAFLGYWGREDLTDEVFTPDGFFRTGDKVRLDDEGFLTVTGRIKDLVKRGGENISPLEIETILLSHPDVAHAAVIGVPDARLGERVCACVVSRRAALTLEELLATFAASGAAKQKWPEQLELFDALPLSPAGKVNKNRLRAEVADRTRP